MLVTYVKYCFVSLINESNFSANVLARLLRFLEEQVPHLETEASYLTQTTLFSLLTPVKFWDVTLNLPTTASFQTLSFIIN